MGAFDALARRALKIPKAGLGMALGDPTKGGPVKAATVSTQYVGQGMPLQMAWDASLAAQTYLGHTYVMRCVRLRADTVAGLPFVAGPDPDDPSTTTPGSPLSQLLGPATPQEPGGPNPTTSSRAMWAWSIVQRIVSGRMGWELTTDPKSGQINAIWPLVSAALSPIPSKPGSDHWWDGFQYQTPTGVIDMDADRVFYDWRPAINDWRQAESCLEAARLPIEIAVACDRYMWALLKNGMVASKMVIAPPFEEQDQRRVWEQQFFSQFSGFDNAGKTIFGYAENDYDQQGKLVDQANVQVIDLSMKSVDAQLLDMIDRAKSDINIAIGVPKSLIGDASQRIYANADSEYRNFWTLTAIQDVTELQDGVNINLAPRLGTDVGWFDLSRVAALQPPNIFQPPALADAINAGVVTPELAADLLGIPKDAANGEDSDTIPLGEEASGSSMPASGGSRSLRLHGQGSRVVDAPEGWVWKHRPLTTFTLKSGRSGWNLVRQPRERVTVINVRSTIAAPRPALVDEVESLVARIQRRRELGIRATTGLKAAGVAVKAADTGRVLMLQRTITDKNDPAAGKWEFPGGKIEPGEDSLDAAGREWSEETGLKLPDGNVAGSWTSPNGVYRGHVLVIPAETDLKLNPDRPKVANPDNPKGKYQETAAWMDPEHVPGNPSVRDEVVGSADTWLPVVRAAQPAVAAPVGSRSVDDGWLDRLGDALALAEGAA